jgi:hypothetical protein
MIVIMKRIDLNIFNRLPLHTKNGFLEFSLLLLQSERLNAYKDFSHSPYLEVFLSQIGAW